MQVLTLATPALLPQARVLADSLGIHQPDWRHEILLIGLDRGASGSYGGTASVRSAAEVLDLDVEAVIARHDDAELITLLLPRLLQSYIERDAGPALHLPPTAWVTASLEPVEAALDDRSVLLVPRMTSDVPDDGLEPTREQMEAVGRISEAIMGVDGTPGAEGFLAWWGWNVEQMLGSLDGRERGARPEDRAWLARLLELAPARFSTAVLDDAGCNLSLWNLHAHSLEQTDAGPLVDGAAPVRFVDLTGFDPSHPHRLAATATRVRVSRSPVLRGLCARYADELQAAGWRAVNHRQNVGRRLANGLVYDDALFSLHARAVALGEDFGDLFDEHGSHAFTQWLEGPAPEGAGHGINRYVYYRVVRERPDVMRAYPDLDGADGTEYVAWCWAFGRSEMGIPERFLPPRDGQLDGGANEPQLEASAPPGYLGARGDAAAVGELGSRSENGSGTSAQGGAEEHPPAHVSDAVAVRLTGYLSHTLGLGAAARGYAQALAAAGVPTSTATVPLHHLELPVELASGYGRHSFEDIAHEGRHGVEIVAVNPDELPGLVARLGDDYFRGPKIGIWGWETNSIPARWAPAFELIDEIWVYSRFMAENIRAAASCPVLALPPPVHVAQRARPLRLGVPDDAYLFLFVFDYLSTIQRKNPVGLIEAFRRAFAPGEGPHLLIKTINAPLRPLAEEAVLWAAHDRPDIHVADRSLSQAERDGLIAACDCYVSLHRSEGFGLTMAEAMAMGKPVIGTRYSGNLDFMTDENSLLVDCTPTLVGPECEIYPADGEWAEPSVEHAARLMGEVVAHPQRASALGERARVNIAEALSPEATGAAMRSRLEELVLTASSG